MGDLIGDGAAWLAGVQKSHVSRLVDYVTAAGTVEDVAATIGAIEQPVDQAGVMNLLAQTREFIIHAADLILDEAQIVPQRGHQIRDTDDDGTVHIYQVTSPGESGDVWRWGDPNRIRRIIHTTYIGVD